jgi:hypothetical protein
VADSPREAWWQFVLATKHRVKWISEARVKGYRAGDTLGFGRAFDAGAAKNGWTCVKVKVTAEEQ